MQVDNKIKIILLLFLVLIPNLLLAGYSLDTTSITNGANSYGADKLLKLRAIIYNVSEIKFEISKADGSRFTTSGDIFLKVGSPETYGWNRNVGRIYKNSYTKYFKHNLDDYSGYPKKFYARFESDNGGWAWVGPITVSKIEDKDTIKPTGSISGFKDIIKRTKLYIKVKANDNKRLSTMTLHIQKVGGSVVLSKSWYSYSISFSSNYTIRTSNWSVGTYNYSYFIKDASDNIKTITGSFKIFDSKDTTKPTGGLNSPIKGSYIKGSKITFNIVAYDNKELKTISLNISKSTSKIPISSVSKTWSASSTSFSRVYILDTNNLNVGKYNYALWVKDDADNIAEVAQGSFSVIEDNKPTPTPTPSPTPTPTPTSTSSTISKTLGVRYEQPICKNTIAPTVNLVKLLEKKIVYNGVESASIEFEARVTGGSYSCRDYNGVYHRRHIFTAWKTDKGGFEDITTDSSLYKYKKIRLIIPMSQKDEFRVQLYVGDDLGKEVYKEYIKSNGKDTDGDGVSDKYDYDDDNDGLTDYQESKYSFLNPLVPDAHKDYDGDGISNIDEINKYWTDPSRKDSDGDGFSDGDEIKAGTNPKDKDDKPEIKPKDGDDDPFDLKSAPLKLFSVPIYTTKNKIQFHVYSDENGELVVNGKEIGIKFNNIFKLKRVEVTADRELYKLQLKTDYGLSDAIYFRLYKSLEDIELRDQKLSLQAKYGSNAGKYLIYYRIDLEKKRRLIIDMEADFDTYLSITDMKLKRLYEDDNGGSGTNSKLDGIVLDAGSYYIEATTARKGVKGEFDLSIIEEK